MPRWRNGYGIQLIQQHQERIFSNDEKVSFDITRLEGVYTWVRSVRATAKLQLTTGASNRAFANLGAGDLRLAIPLKKYFNLEGQSGSYTFAPQVEIPLGTAAMNGPFRRTASLITSLGYETETYWLHLGASVQWAYQPEVRRHWWSSQLFSGINGFGFGWNGHVKAVAVLESPNPEDLRARLQSVIYGLLTDTWHWQATFSELVWQNRRIQGVANDRFVTVGVAFVR